MSGRRNKKSAVEPSEKFSLCGSSAHPRQFRSPSASLALPSLKGIPATIYFPGIEFMGLDALQKWAKFLLCVNPECRLKWKRGDSTQKIASDILYGIKTALQRKVDYHGLDEVVKLDIDDKFNLNIALSGLYETVYPIMYEDALKRVRDVAPGLEDLFNTAIRILGSTFFTWEDQREITLEFYEECLIPEAEDYSGEDDDEHLAQTVACYEEIKNTGPSRFFNLRGACNEEFKKTFNSYKEAVNGLSPGSDAENALINWLKDAGSLFENNFKLEIHEEHGEYLCKSETLPILWSPENILTDEYDQRINHHVMECGDAAGIHLSLPVNSLKDIEEGIRYFREDVELMSLHIRVFTFF